LTSAGASIKFRPQYEYGRKVMKAKNDDIVKSEILQAAVRVFQKWGLNKTTMEDIAQEAGKGKSTLYYYFESKEAIFEASVMMELDYLLSKAKKATLEANTAKEKIKKYIVTVMIEITNYAVLYSVARREIRGNQKLLGKLLEKFQVKEEMFVKEILVAGIQSKEFHFIDESELNEATKAVVGIIHALELYFGLENDDIKQIEMASRLIANGI
jgi:AcrR family transcriptional regulator